MVDGEPITLADVVRESRRQEHELSAVYTGERLKDETQKLRRKILDELIFRKLVMREYNRNPFPIPKQLIEEIIDHHAREMGGLTRAELEKRLFKEGLSLDTLRKQAKERIAVDAILANTCDKQVTVTPKDVYDEYQRDASRWTRPAQIDFQILQLNKENGRSGADAKGTAEKLKPSVRMADEALFTRLVTEYSDGMNAVKGGYIKDMPVSSQRPEFQAALKGCKAGEVIGPVETPEAVFFIRINAVRPAMLVPFESISEDLTQQVRRREIEKKRREYEQKLRDNAMIVLYI